MKYIKQFIKTLSDKVEIKENEKSNSTYCIIDDTFVVRLSDHLSPSDARTGINVNVVSIWKNPNFILIIKKSIILSKLSSINDGVIIKSITFPLNL